MFKSSHCYEILLQERCYASFFGYDPKREDGSYAERTIILIAMFNAWTGAAVGCLVEKEKHGGHRQGEHADVYGKMM